MFHLQLSIFLGTLIGVLICVPSDIEFDVFDECIGFLFVPFADVHFTNTLCSGYSEFRMQSSQNNILMRSIHS